MKTRKGLIGVLAIIVTFALFTGAAYGYNWVKTTRTLKLNATEQATVRCQALGGTLTTERVDDLNVRLTCNAAVTTTTTTVPSTTTTVAPTTTTTTPPQGIAACDPAKGMADEQCWANNTGVENLTTSTVGDRWTRDQIRSGQAAAQLTHLTGDITITTSGTDAAHPYVFENKWVTGCILVHANYVYIHNVFIDNARVNEAACRNEGQEGAGGALNTYKNAFLYQGVVVEDSLITTGSIGDPVNSTQNVGIGGQGITMRRVNVMGGNKILGWTSRLSMYDSYVHDVGYPYVSTDHMDSMWEQGIDYITVSHSYVQIGHAAFGNDINSSGGCLCNGGSSYHYFENTFFDGGGNWGIEADNQADQRGLMWRNLYFANHGYGSYSGGPTGAPDYVAGSTWSPNLDPSYGFPTSANSSRCTNMYRVTDAGVATKIAC